MSTARCGYKTKLQNQIYPLAFAPIFLSFRINSSCSIESQACATLATTYFSPMSSHIISYFIQHCSFSVYKPHRVGYLPTTTIHPPIPVPSRLSLSTGFHKFTFNRGNCPVMQLLYIKIFRLFYQIKNKKRITYQRVYP